jgi:hypothetical protein
MIMANPYIEVHPIEVRGTKYQVHVTEGGDWCAQVGKENIRSSTRVGLRDKLRELSAKASVTIAVPFTWLNDNGGGREGPRTSRGLVTGVHAGNGNLMVTWTTGWRAGRKAQWEPNYQDVIFDGDATDEDIERWAALRKAKNDATCALELFEQEHKIYIRDKAVVAVQEAVNADA